MLVGAELVNPGGKGLHEGGEKFPGVLFNERAFFVKQGWGIADIGFRLLQYRHIQAGEGLAQVMIRAKTTQGTQGQ